VLKPARLLYVCSLALACAAPATAQTWLSLGPPTGEVRRVVAAPSQPSTVIAIPERGGLFLTTNAGASWQPISGGLCDVHVSDVAFHPTTPATIYAATASAGVCRSTDSGATWTTLASGLPVDANAYPLEVTTVAINPSTPAALLAGTTSGLYRSVNGGSTWTAVAAAGSQVAGIAISPSTPAVAYAAIANTIFKSADSGASWTAMSAGLPPNFAPVALAIDPTNADVVYLAADTVYKTTNGAAAWARSDTGIGSTASFYDIAVSPADPNVLYLSGNGGCALCKSTDGGASWAPVSAAGVPSGSALQSLAIDKLMPSRIYAGTAGGVFRSTDSGLTWFAASTGLASREISAPALFGGSPASLLAGARGVTGGVDVLKLTGGLLPFSNVTTPLSGNDRGGITSAAVDPTNPNVIYVLAGDFNNPSCALPYKTTNGGTSWTLVNSGIPATICGNALTLDSVSPSTLYLAVVTPTFNGTGCCEVSLYKTTTGGTTWSASNSGIFQNSANRISISPHRSNVLYAAAGGSVYRSSNSGATWAAASSGLPAKPPDAQTTAWNVGRVAIDPTDDNIVYAATPTGVFRTANGGASWTARQGGWPTLNGMLYSAAALAVDPNAPATIYAGPSTPWPGPNSFVISNSFVLGNARGAGLLKSTDSGATWTSAGTEIAGAIVSDVVFDGSRAIYAATNNGVFRFSTFNPPAVTLDRATLTFAATSSGTALTARSASQTIHLSQGGGPLLTWTATSDKPWLTVTPASGSGSAALDIAVKFDATLPPSGIVAGGITITVTGAANEAGPIGVALSIVPTETVSRPFGVFDTPAGDATVLAGSIALTGWTLDNVGVVRVELWRDLQPGETTPPFASTPGDPRRGKVFLANATFVDGARPDVEGLNPNTPSAYRAGWGYLLLTRGLWNQGNGTYTLHAFAFDQEDNLGTIGSKTVIVSNDTATKPFGSIDTPPIGGDASGPNFGWALTPKVNGVATCKIQPSGVQVSIDSGPLQPVVFGDARTDIAGAFTGFSNTPAAGGHFIFDWSTLSNGPHTIGWLITDDCNRADGVGSRFFNVTGGTSVLAGFRLKAEATHPNPVVSAFRRNEFDDQVLVARGYGELPVVVQPGLGGWRTIEVRQGDRIEVRLPRGFDAAHQLGPNGERRPLPIGTTWDAASGTFYWQPAPGFLGRYRILFTDGTERIDVRLIVVPQRGVRR
jgi:photosystem II stability/assembly factor-like uncharacterized protein